MGIGDKLRDLFGVASGSLHPDGLAELHIDDRAFDDWDVVREFDELETARAWRQQLTDTGIQGVLTADHPLDEFGMGHIFLCVPPGRWSEANERLDEP